MSLELFLERILVVIQGTRFIKLVSYKFLDWIQRLYILICLEELSISYEQKLTEGRKDMSRKDLLESYIIYSKKWIKKRYDGNALHVNALI